MPYELARFLVILSPFLIFSVIAAGVASDQMKEEAYQQMLYDDLTLTNYEKLLKKDKKQKEAGVSYQYNRRYEMLGLSIRFEKLVTESIMLFAGGCAAGLFIYKAGILLAVTIGAVFALMPFQMAKGKLDKTRDALTVEFLEKMRDTSSLLSVGKTFDTALAETIQQGAISPALERELNRVRQDIYVNQSPSKAFMTMYDRLEIDEIKTFAQTFAVYEKSGGNLITVMRANDRFATNKLDLKNEQLVFVNSQKMQQKFIIGLPIGFITLMFIFMPSIFGNYYGTFSGQMVGILCVLMLYGGVVLANSIAGKGV